VSSPSSWRTNEYLAIYLNDHRAGAAGGARLARRVAHNNRSNRWGPRLGELAEAVSADKAKLDEVRTVLGVSGGALKRTGAVVAELGGRLKPNGHILTYSPLSRVIEVEALMAGVQVKQRLWATLRLLTPARPALNLFDFAALESRGATQLATLAEVHEWAAEQLVRD
jgi:hypothetical protein